MSSSSESELTSPILFHPPEHHNLLPAFASLHASCIVSPPYPILTFLPPITPEKANEIEIWWKARFDEVLAGTRHIVFVMVGPQPGETARVAGVCMLSTPMSETGPHRGFVEKFMVDPVFRGKGVGSRIMRMTEKVAEEKRAWLLMLDTDVGSLAEEIYRRMGYIECGRIPEYDVWSKTGELKTEVFFYKKILSLHAIGKESRDQSENEAVRDLN